MAALMGSHEEYINNFLKFINMTFEEMQKLLGQILSLECALGHYKLFDEIDKATKLEYRLSIYYDTDEADKIKDDCNQFLLKHSETMERFDRDTL